MSEKGEERHAGREFELAALPDAGALVPEAQSSYAEARRRLHGRHRAWRATMPTIDALFDDNSQRAKALAGNLATELEGALCAWLRADEGRLSVDARQEWLRRQALAWRAIARPMARDKGWDAATLEVFDAVLEELTARAVQRARIASVASRRPLPAGVARGLTAGLWRLIRSWFRPDREEIP